MTFLYVLKLVWGFGLQVYMEHYNGTDAFICLEGKSAHATTRRYKLFYQVLSSFSVVVSQ